MAPMIENVGWAAVRVPAVLDNQSSLADLSEDILEEGKCKRAAGSIACFRCKHLRGSKGMEAFEKWTAVQNSLLGGAQVNPFQDLMQTAFKTSFFGAGSLTDSANSLESNCDGFEGKAV